MTATGWFLTGVFPAAWYLVGAWRRGQRIQQSTTEHSEAPKRQADELRRAEIRRGGRHLMRRERRWWSLQLPLLEAEEYPTLLCNGVVEPAERYCDEDAWFAGIRARAEADGLRVTLVHRWSSVHDDEVEPWAVLVSPAGEEQRGLGHPGNRAEYETRRAWVEAQWGDTLIRARIRAARSRN